jgi:predicted Zn finger-like uncharacterized protein
MDVRCEKCMTVYEFDDSQVGENGVTVKCTQCGNLFKVKKRIATVEMAMGSGGRSPAWTPPSLPAPQQPATPKPTQRGTPVPAPRAPTPAKGVPLQRESAPAQKSATVQAKRATTPARARNEDDPALSTTAPMATLEGPSAMGDALLPGGEDPAFASTTPKPRITPPPRQSVSALGIGTGEIDQVIPRRSRAPMMAAGAGVLLLLVLGGGALLLRGRSGSDAPRIEQYTQGRNLFLLDTEDSFHQAGELLQQAHGADANNALVLAALGELDATWAGYLRDEAREIEAKAGAAGEVATRTLRKTAQQHLDDAKRFTGDALVLSPDALEVNRAMAEFLRVDGAPMAEAERYLRRALDKRPGDAESTYAQGALLYREGRMEDARSKLEQANTLSLGATQRPLFRALYLLAKLDVQLGRKEDARRELSQLTSLNPQHERSRLLLSSLETPVATPPPVAVAVAAPVPTPAAPAPPPPPKKSSNSDEEPASGGDYNKLVAQADRLSENGQSEKARKIYEKALQQNPQGVEALTGLGYCDLDGERFLGALDHFKQALTVVPEYGEALMGLAEAYKVRGDKAHAVEFYKRYLKAQPGGPKASMAQKNVRDLEVHLPPPEAPAIPAPEEKKPEAKPEEVRTEGKIGKSDDKPELPKPPPTEP